MDSLCGCVSSLLKTTFLLYLFILPVNQVKAENMDYISKAKSNILLSNS